MRNTHGVNPLRIGTLRAEEKCACSTKTGTAGKSRALLATAPPREDEEKQMRVDSQIYRLNMSRFQQDDLRMQGSSRGSAKLTARFQKALQLDDTGELPATDLSANAYQSRHGVTLCSPSRRVPERPNRRSRDGRVPWLLRPGAKGAVLSGWRGTMTIQTGRSPGWMAPPARHSVSATQPEER